jgi:hypothetical protein
MLVGEFLYLKMKIIKAIITTIIMMVLVIPFCRSQNMQYRYKLRPNVKAKLDSLYPHATNITVYKSLPTDTTQRMDINCRCDETTGMIVLLFDTNGNLLSKETHYHSINDLPNTIISYMEKNTAPNRKFDNDYMIKRTNNRGEMSYGIVMQEFATAYMLWFKSSGEFINREVMQGDGL